MDLAHIRDLISAGAVLHSGRRLRDPSFRVASGALVRAATCLPPVPSVDLRERVLYRDAHLLVVEKPVGVASGPTPQGSRGTLPALLAQQLPLARAPLVVHRLDRDVSGVLALALTREGARRLSAAFASGAVRKEYRALVAGRPPAPEGRIEAPIAKDPARRGKMRVHPAGAPSRTDYRVIAAGRDPTVGPNPAAGRDPTVGSDPDPTQLAVRLYTGRTHQIRLHLAHLGCPIVGDPLYGGPAVVGLAGRRVRAGRLCLHAEHLALPGAIFDRPDPVSFRSPPPSSLEAWLATPTESPAR